ncbi:MAG TPA: GNAT family N-acetyltransferase [Caulobacteraceae bacterium]|jgi:predicted acetyltransferase|nr:GNAT family N-acetyltransferase [Caulobacteraceae bacterium]
MPEIELTVASLPERNVIENMMQFYVHDFSEFWWDRDDGDLEADGRFAPYPLDPYWSSPHHTPLLARTAGRLVGFALVNSEGHGGAPVDRNVAEFFIARKYRRGGYGTAVVHGLFDRWPGHWEAAVARRNVGARAFWRRAVVSHPRVSQIEEHDVTSAHWNGPILRFRIGEATA